MWLRPRRSFRFTSHLLRSRSHLQSGGNARQWRCSWQDTAKRERMRETSSNEADRRNSEELTRFLSGRRINASSSFSSQKSQGWRALIYNLNNRCWETTRRVVPSVASRFRTYPLDRVPVLSFPLFSFSRPFCRPDAFVHTVRARTGRSFE